MSSQRALTAAASPEGASPLAVRSCFITFSVGPGGGGGGGGAGVSSGGGGGRCGGDDAGDDTGECRVSDDGDDGGVEGDALSSVGEGPLAAADAAVLRKTRSIKSMSNIGRSSSWHIHQSRAARIIDRGRDLTSS